MKNVRKCPKKKKTSPKSLKNVKKKCQEKYCPETLTGTAFSIKQYAQIITWQTAAQQATTAVSVSVCWLHYDLPQTACDYHKVGMSVKGETRGYP